jgi:CubicO group peptidase (beta-lactamase class C family)
MRILKTLICFILAITILWWLLPSQQVTSNASDNIDDYVTDIMQESAIPGMAVAKFVDGEVTFIGTYGHADIASNRLVTQDTQFNIASISKPIMGAVMLMLVDQGKLDIDADINTYLPFPVDNPHLDNEIITVRNIASHSASIADYYDTSSYAENKDTDISLQDHVKSLLLPSGEQYADGAHYLTQSPGNYRKYSNLAAGVAGVMVENISARSLNEYTREVLFTRTGAPSASWLLHDLVLTDIATPYEVKQCIPFLPLCADTESPELNTLISKVFNPPQKFKHYQAYPHFGNPQYPDGGIRISIKELASLTTALLNNKDINGHSLLSKDSYTEMFNRQLDSSLSEGQRFFWRDNSMGLTGHMGSDLGVFTALYFDIKSKTGFIVLMNRGVDGMSGAAMKKIADKLTEATN